MKNIKPAVTIIAILVIALGIGGVFFLWNNLHRSAPVAEVPAPVAEVPAKIIETPAETIKAPADGSIAISLNGSEFSPFDVMVIDAGGLDRTAAATVIFTTHSGEVIAVPPLEVATNTIAVAVPLIGYDKTKGVFSSDQASLKVVQEKKVNGKLIIKTSNQSSYFTIYQPAVPSAFQKVSAGQIPKGVFTELAIEVSLERLKIAAEQITASSTLSEALAKEQKGMEQLLAQVQTMEKDPQAKVELAMNDGTSVDFSGDDLAWLDAFFEAYLGNLEKHQSPTARADLLQLIPAAEASEATDCKTAILHDFKNIPSWLVINAMQLCDATEAQKNEGANSHDNENPKSNADYWFNKYEYGGQIPFTIAFAYLSSKWDVPEQIAAAIYTSLTTQAAVDYKKINWDTYNITALKIDAIFADAVLKEFGKKAIFSDLIAAVEVWNLLCKAFPESGCMSAEAIVEQTGVIILDVAKNPENLLYVANEMIDGLLQPMVDAALLPEFSKYLELDGSGIALEGFDSYSATIKLKTSPAPISPEPIKTVPSPSPSPTPTPKPGPTCMQKKQATYAKCKAGCATENDNMETYSACTSACDNSGDLLKKSDCINTCIGNWSKGISDQSKCLAACADANNAAVCP